MDINKLKRMDEYEIDRTIMMLRPVFRYIEDLSKTERRIFLAMVSGLRTADIASAFNVVEKTVKFHLTNVFNKLCLDRFGVGRSGVMGALFDYMYNDIMAFEPNVGKKTFDTTGNCLPSQEVDDKFREMDGGVVLPFGDRKGGINGS